MRRIRAALPNGDSLTPAQWYKNHRVVQGALLLLTIAGPAYATAAGIEPLHLLAHAVPLPVLLAMSARENLGRTARAVSAALGLMLAAALIVDTAGGATEAHFAFFVLLPLTILYGAWSPLAVAVGFVGLHHSLAGLLHPGAAFPVGTDAIPMALLHGAAILAESVVCLLVWRTLEDRHAAVERLVAERTAELRSALEETETAHAEIVRRLSMAVEFRDEDTGEHIERIGRLATLIGAAAGLEPEACERLHAAAPLHDAGKVAVPDAVLLKPGRLTPEERAIVETHAGHGFRLLRGSSCPTLELAATIAWTHHERWDGGGYPRGLAGEEIPLEGRIVAIADVYDALTSDRVYRKAMDTTQAAEVMREGRGTHFDPQLLDIFLSRVRPCYEGLPADTQPVAALDTPDDPGPLRYWG